MPVWRRTPPPHVHVPSRDRERHYPFSLAFWVSTNPMVPGSSWLTMAGGGGWLKGFLWAGISQAFADHPRLRAQSQRSSSQCLPNALTPCPGRRYHSHSCSPQPCSWALVGSSPHGHKCVPPANAAHCLATKVGRGGRGRYPKLFSSTSLGYYFSAWSVAGCPGGEGECWKWVKTEMLPSEERNWGFQTHFSQCWAAEAFRHPATNLQSGSRLVFYLFRLPLKALPKVRKFR